VVTELVSHESPKLVGLKEAAPWNIDLEKERRIEMMERVEGCEEGRVRFLAQRIWCFKEGFRVGLTYPMSVTELVSHESPKLVGLKEVAPRNIDLEKEKRGRSDGKRGGLWGGKGQRFGRKGLVF
jgi:hypothetical protein